MEVNGPIIIIDDDDDDQLLLTPIIQELAPDSEIRFFTDSEAAIEYLKTTQERPFLIISEVSLQRMNGLELRQQIEADPVLRKRAIPFIFFTHPVFRKQVEEAYELTIQGYFEKQQSIEQIKSQLASIIAYWTACLHPNRFDEDE